MPGCCHPDSAPTPPQQNVALACLFATHCHAGSLGCSVNLPLGSRPVDPHSTAVWCGNLLHSSPQPHTAGFSCIPRSDFVGKCSNCRPSLDGVLATTTKICTRGRSGQGQPQPAPQSPMPFLHDDALLLARLASSTATVDCEGSSSGPRRVFVLH